MEEKGLKEKVERYEKALKEISQSPKVRGIGTFENRYNDLIDKALLALRDTKLKRNEDVNLNHRGRRMATRDYY